MKTSFLTITFLFLIAICVHAQDAKPIFVEHFDDNLSQWPMRDDNDYTRVIADGKMKIEGRTKTHHWFGKSLNVSKKMDLLIETEMAFQDSKNGYAGIMWGGDDDYKKMCFFMVSPNGTWNYGVWAPEFQSYTGTQKNAAVNKGAATNKIAIRKKGGKIILLVNDVEVHTASFPKMYGKHCGIVSGGGAIAFEAEYFKVSEAID